LSFKQAEGEISDTTFNDNSAEYYSGNLFLSFSTVTLYNITFEDTLPADPYEVLQTKATQGQFIFISLGVDVSIEESRFLNGISSQGGAIFLNGLSTLTIADSHMESNYAYQNGGAIYGTGYDHLQVTNTDFTNNYAGQLGSEVYALFSNEPAIFTNIMI